MQLECFRECFLRGQLRTQLEGTSSDLILQNLCKLTVERDWVILIYEVFHQYKCLPIYMYIHFWLLCQLPELISYLESKVNSFQQKRGHP